MLKQFIKTHKFFNVLRQTKKHCSPITPAGFHRLPSTPFSTTARKCAKLFIETENNYAFNLLAPGLPENFPFKPPVVPAILTTKDDFETVLSKVYRTSSATEIIQVFRQVKQYCLDNAIPVSDSRFDNLVDGLMDHCQDLTDEELYDLMKILGEMPMCDSYTSHNMHDIWSCLDDMCLRRIQDWDFDKMLLYGDLWFKLSLGKLSDYVFKVVDLCTKKADTLTKDQLVHTFFLINISRRQKVGFQLEYALQEKIQEMSVDDMAVVSLGYFKTQSSIKLFPIMQTMLNKITQEAGTIHEISLTAILKILRLSRPGKLSKDILETLDVLSDQLDRLSNLSALHVALLGTSVQSFHQKSLVGVSKKLVKDLSDVRKLRLKDIERLLHTLSMFDFAPKIEPEVFRACFDELHQARREEEIIRYPRCLSCALHFLSLRNIYSYPMMDKLLDMQYIEDSFGKSVRNVPREIFALDRSIDIECPDYKGNRLPPNIRYRVAKWHTDYAPSYDQYKKISTADQLILDTIDQCVSIVGGNEFIRVEHVLPHYARPDIILCKDTATNKFVVPNGFQSYILGDIMVARNDGALKWYAVVILGWNNTIRESAIPLGQMVAKGRQLRKVGYEPVFVYWNEFMGLTTEQKKLYVMNKLS